MVDEAGPWGRRDGGQPAPAPGIARVSLAAPNPSLAGNLVSTLLLAGLLFYLWRDWVLVVAAVVGVFVHETGHVLAMNLLGCGPARLRIVPFFGGAAIPARPPATQFRDVLISLSGPVFGLLAILPFAVIWLRTGDTAWLRGSAVIAGLNLMNLIPAPPLDGARALGPVLARVHPMVERAVLALIGGGAALWLALRGDWLIAIFIGLSVFAALRRGQYRSAVPLNGREWALSLLGWVCAAGLCGLMLVVILDRMGFTIDLAHLPALSGLARPPR